MKVILIVPGKPDTNLPITTSGEPILPAVGDVITDVHGDKVVVTSIEWFLHHPFDGTQVWVRAEPYSDSTEYEFHDDQTIRKVYDALRRAGLGPVPCQDAVNNMQNEGILFRERK